MLRGLFVVGTGEDTLAWEDNWIPRDGALCPFACVKDEPPIRISDFINQSTKHWDVALLNTYFLPVDVQITLNIPLSTRSQSDFWAWHYDKKGIFSVRAAYRMLSATKARCEAWLDATAGCSDTLGLQKSWTSLWHVQVPAKLKVFLWRLAQHSLPTTDLLHHRNISTTRACAICGAEDSWRHSLIDYMMARCVWSLSNEEMVEHMCQVQEPKVVHHDRYPPT